MEHEADVIVVGARAAGAATAMLLARAGASVVLVDREKPGADTLSTHALMRGGVLQLHRWGLLDQVVAAGTPAIRTTVFHYASSDVEVAIKPTGGVDALYAPRRTVLDPILVAAAATAGVQVQYGSRVVALLREQGRIAGVATHVGGGAERELRARVVVGADGRHSTIARLVEAPTTTEASHTSAFTYGYFAGLDAVGYEWAYRPEGTAGFIPTNDGLTCVFAGHLPSRVGRGGPSVLQELLDCASSAMGARLRAAALASPVRTFTGEPGWLRRPYGPGWALVGDAGSWKDPISAHGLTDALRDAELVADAIGAELANPGCGTEPYRHYERTRDRLTLPILESADEVAAMEWDEARIIELLRRLNAAMTEEVELVVGLDDPGRSSPSPARHVLASAG
ncbi:MAG: FAD-dependent monooxygenase [Actinobacteria bacterium]|nr:FAD-dependent monooxygenase [Actinomycetota bacterium]